MRLSVYYRPNKDDFYVKYYPERYHTLPLLTYNHYGHLVVQYIYIEDKKIFWNYDKYEKYLDKKYKRRKPSLRYRVGQAIIQFGRNICFGKEEKIKYVYVYRYPWWKRK